MSKIKERKNEEIFNLNELNETVKKEKLDLAVVCFGGCCSNTLNDILEKNGYKVKSKVFDKILCHCPTPVKLDIPIIYLYRDPRESLLSMKRRGKGYWDVNQRKLSNSKKVNYSDGNLLKLMIDQFYKWTSYKDNKMIIIKYEELFEESVVEKLKIFLNNDELTNLPVPYKEPHTNQNILETIDDNLKNLFNRYSTQINYINNYSTS